jgi:hypothetical protein
MATTALPILPSSTEGLPVDVDFQAVNALSRILSYYEA